LEQGEKPTRYFFNLENQNRSRKNWKNFIVICTHLKKSKPQGENKSFESFVKGIEIPQLNADEQDSLEHDFTFEELKEAVSSFSDNSRDAGTEK